MKIYFAFFINFTMLFLVSSCTSSSLNFEIPIVPIDNTPAPVLTGKLIYHTYSCYNCNDSQLFLYNFSSKERTNLSQNWAITNAMNAHFSADGTTIAFMGISQITNSWDIYIYTFTHIHLHIFQIFVYTQLLKTLRTNIKPTKN
jgi:hypothetical protein